MKSHVPAVLFLLSLFLFAQFSCREKKTDNAADAYKFWAGESPSKDVQVLHGKYWQSSHWSKEYIVWLELKASKLWREEYIKQNHLVESKAKDNPPSDIPSWFKPDAGFRVLIPTGLSQGSVYYEDSTNGRIFIYEIQL